ncbi:MAG: outer membrane protein assembly factor BamA, partial [Bacteroidota bacterium]
MNYLKCITCSLLLMAGAVASFGQTATTDSLPLFDYSEKARDYEIGGIKVTGANFSDENALKAIAGFRVGDQIRVPGGDIPRAMKALWNLRLFTDIQIRKEKTIGDIIFLEIAVTERPRLSRHSYRGAKKSVHDELNDEVNKYLVKNGIVTENIKVNAKTGVEKYYIEKGYLDAKVRVIEIPDSSRINAVRLVFDVDRGDRVKIQEIVINGNETVSERKLKKQLGETKEKKRLFASSKFINNLYETDKQ